ncbi:MAG: PilZ domain-containing protein [Candidatus Aceula meridiana]|nr:PilZ domain-containing protein [Candidatus Aceula meridiana]
MGTIEHRKLFRAEAYLKISYESKREPIIKGEFVTVDISSIGLHVIGPDKLEIGTDLIIKLQIKDRPESVTALSKVVWQKPCSYVPASKNAYFAAGLMLLDMSPEDAILTSDFIFDVAKEHQFKYEKKIIDQLEPS